MMITKEQYLDARKIIDSYVVQLENSHIAPRYFLDVRNGCAAVRDKWHSSYDEDYPGLHSDTQDVVEYIHGFQGDGSWRVREEDVVYLENLCNTLNKQSK